MWSQRAVDHQSIWARQGRCYRSRRRMSSVRYTEATSHLMAAIVPPRGDGPLWGSADGRQARSPPVHRVADSATAASRALPDPVRDGRADRAGSRPDPAQSGAGYRQHGARPSALPRRECCRGSAGVAMWRAPATPARGSRAAPRAGPSVAASRRGAPPA
jgi:hypothetical protein